MTTTPPYLFCFGLGFSAQVLARRLKAKGWRVAGTIRPESDKDRGKAEALRAEGIEVYAFDRGRPLENIAEVLSGVTHVLSSIPPDGEGDALFDHHAEDLLACQTLQWFAYLSTTGVYGNYDGALVDEETPLKPSSPRSQRRAAAETAWRTLCAERGLPVHIFRLAGIYGPGRSPLDALRAGRVKQRIDKPGHIFSRIHVEDIANVLEASIAKPNAGRVYNLCDDAPEEPAVVAAHACKLLGMEPPPLVPFEEAEMTPMARSFWLDNKRVDNSRIKQELGVTLQYPDYDSGLRSLL